MQFHEITTHDSLVLCNERQVQQRCRWWLWCLQCWLRRCSWWSIWNLQCNSAPFTYLVAVFHKVFNFVGLFRFPSRPSLNACAAARFAMLAERERRLIPRNLFEDAIIEDSLAVPSFLATPAIDDKKWRAEATLKVSHAIVRQCKNHRYENEQINETMDSTWPNWIKQLELTFSDSIVSNTKQRHVSHNDL